MKQNVKSNLKAAETLLKNDVNAEQAASDILALIRRLEPEQQNDVVKTILKELAIDRRTSLRAYDEARDRAAKNMEVFMYNALGLEKTMAEIAEKAR
jgi:hypothetical protein